MSDENLDIDYVAQLSRLHLKDEEKQRFTSQLAPVLDYFKKLAAVDVEGIEPTAHAFPLHNVWHEDVASEPFTQETALKNAPAQKDQQIIVPRVVE